MMVMMCQNKYDYYFGRYLGFLKHNDLETECVLITRWCSDQQDWLFLLCPCQ